MINKKWLFIFVFVLLMITSVSADFQDWVATGSGGVQEFDGYLQVYKPIGYSNIIKYYGDLELSATYGANSGSYSGNIAFCNGTPSPSNCEWDVGTYTLNYANIPSLPTQASGGYFNLSLDWNTAGITADSAVFELEGVPHSPVWAFYSRHSTDGISGSQPFALGNFYRATGSMHIGNLSGVTRNFSVNIKNLAGQVLEGMPVDVSKNDLSGSAFGYTDANGNFNSSLVIYGNASTHITVTSHDIYEQIDWDFDFTSSPFQINLIAFQASPSGDYRNITYHIQNPGGIPLDDVLVTHISSQYSQRSEYTDLAGNAYFYSVPVINNIANYRASLTGYQESFNSFVFTADMNKTITLYPTGVTPTPTSTGGTTPTPTLTPVSFDTWTLIPMYASIAFGSNVALIADCNNASKEQNTGGLRRVLYYEKPPNKSSSLVGVYQYNSSSGNWDFRENNSVIWKYNVLYDQLQLTTRPKETGLYQYSVYTYGENSVSFGTANCEVLVTGSSGQTGGTLEMVLQAQDQLIGAHLSNYQMNITDSSNVITEFGTVSYDKKMVLDRGVEYTLKASKTGYDDGSYTFTVSTDSNVEAGDFGAIATVNLFPKGSITVGNTAVSVHIYDADTYYPLGNVLVNISGINITNSPRYTGSSGESAYFIIPQNTLYTVVASKDGYCSVSDTKNSGTENSQYVPLYMKYGSCTGSTPTPTPTQTSVVTTVTTPPWMNGTATKCEPLPKGATFIEMIKHNLACNGFEDTASQNMAMSVLIILFCGLILGRVAKGIGVLAGVIAGAAVSVAMGFLPLWIIVIIIIFAGLIFAGKVFWSSGQ